MRGLLFALILLASWRWVPGADHDELLNRWFEQQKTLTSWKADITQIRSLKTLAQPLVATGRVFVVMPSTFRWELGSPPRTIALRTEKELIIAYPLLNRVERHDLNTAEPGPARQALALLDAGFPKSRSDFEKQFTLRNTTVEEDRLIITLRPRSRRVRRMIKSIQVEVLLETLTLTATELLFADDSTVRNEFRNPVDNPTLDPGLFVIKDPIPSESSPAKEVSP